MRATADTRWIVAKAIDLGFDLCGVVPVEALADRGNLEQWLERGYAGEMRYLHDPRRLDVMRVLPDAKSVVVCALNYNTENPPSTEAVAEAGRREPRAWISRYAWGDDYHAVIGEKLEGLLAAMRGYFDGPFHARAYVDTGPVSERLVAQKAGLGWLAKNTCLINEKLGSWFFLGVILTSLELAPPSEANRLRACRPLRKLPPLSGRLPHRSPDRALRHGRAPLHLLPHHRASRRHSRGVARAPGLAGVRLRYLPGRLSVEPQSAGHSRPSISAAREAARARTGLALIA